jgi:divalent metal cation (Fe/Co/Zn/Cd) transporter
MNAKTCQELLAELVLVIAGVFVFRSMWTLLDSFEFLNDPVALWLSLVLGTVATIWVLRFLIRLKAD